MHFTAWEEPALVPLHHSTKGRVTLRPKAEASPLSGVLQWAYELSNLHLSCSFNYHARRTTHTRFACSKPLQLLSAPVFWDNHRNGTTRHQYEHKL